MDEKLLIQKIRALKTIEPNQEWVNSTYSKITGTTSSKKSTILDFIPTLNWNWKLITVSSFSFALIAILLIPLLILNNQNKQLETQLQLTQQKLEQLTIAVDQLQQKNQEKELKPVIQNITRTLNETGIALKKTKKEDIKKIIPQAIEIQRQKQKTERILATKIEAPEWESSLREIVVQEIEDLENRILTEKDSQLLNEIKEDYKKGDFESALEKIYILSQK
jgi:type VI protein secretion system component VasK